MERNYCIVEGRYSYSYLGMFVIEFPLYRIDRSHASQRYYLHTYLRRQVIGQGAATSCLVKQFSVLSYYNLYVLSFCSLFRTRGHKHNKHVSGRKTNKQTTKHPLLSASSSALRYSNSMHVALAQQKSLSFSYIMQNK